MINTLSLIATIPQVVVRCRPVVELNYNSLRLRDFDCGKRPRTSLNRLSQLPVDILKIDRSFITRLVGDPTAQAVASTIVSLARAFELGTVAEGVESIEQVKLLQSLGCEQSQGYLHSRPVPAEQFEALLATHQNNQAVR